MRPLLIDTAPSMNLVFFNYSVHSINPFQMSYVGPAGDASTKPEAEAVQEARWEELVKRVANEMELLTFLLRPALKLGTP